VSPWAGKRSSRGPCSSRFEPHVQRQMADAATVAANLQFSHGHVWPEFCLLLARFCRGDRLERTTVLLILEHFSDETELADDFREACDDMLCTISDGFDGHARKQSFLAILAILEDHGSALHYLLATSLQDVEDQTGSAAAAHIYSRCVADVGIPMRLKESMRDLAPIIATIVCGENLVANIVGRTLAAPKEVFLHTIALAARADPIAWLSTSNPALASLPVEEQIRGAALTALMELADATFASITETACNPEVQCEAQELLTHAVASVSGLLAEVPSDDNTDKWAEISDEDLPGTEHDALLDHALDAAGRLVQRGDFAFAGLQAAIMQLKACRCWQAIHGMLLVQLRVACGDAAGNGDGVAAQEAASAALHHMGHMHPRVRWAALEVWARLLAGGSHAPLALFDGALDALVMAAANDQYMRVRRRSLLVLMLVSNSSPCPVTAPMQM